MSILKECPCGAVPTQLLISQEHSSRYGTVSGDCDCQWEIEVRFGYNHRVNASGMAIAIEAWNSQKRKGDAHVRSQGDLP